ncbi:hypothetical protein L7F22_024568 [Adiantum nelumboides]|nr:hypothetical protein [Adiantum nelumboides]
MPNSQDGGGQFDDALTIIKEQMATLSTSLASLHTRLDQMQPQSTSRSRPIASRSTHATSSTPSSEDSMDEPNKPDPTDEVDNRELQLLYKIFNAAQKKKLDGDAPQQQFETTTSAIGRVQDVGGECSQPIDLPACQYPISTISKFEDNDHIKAIADGPLCTDILSNLEPVQYLASNTCSDMPFDIDSLERVASPPFLSDFTGKQVHNLISARSTESSAVMANETGTSLLLPLNQECLAPAESLERCQSWEPWALSADHSSGLVPQEKWLHGLYPSLMNTLPVDASFQQRDDFYQQTTFNPEFYLPSSLFSFEESDSRECCCENRVLGKKSCLEFGGAPELEMCGWEDLDVHYKLPPEFVDCITHSLMQDPVITADGHSYERSAIEDWLKSHDTSPKTGEILPPPPGGKGVDKTLRPNHILRCQIIEFMERLLQRNGTHWACNASSWT